MKILVLGHKGLLGHTVFNYFQRNDVEVMVNPFRWPEEDFKKVVKTCGCDYVVNCIGVIPQRGRTDFYRGNLALPVWLGSTGLKVVHPTTDCEWVGSSDPKHLYAKTNLPDAKDDYGKSKWLATYVLGLGFPNVKILRTSIIGPEMESGVSLMSWFLKQTDGVVGYTHHLWNGVTTLEWSKQCHNIINNWDIAPQIVQIGVEPISKYELLKLMGKVFNKTTPIFPTGTTDTIVNKCLLTDFPIKPLEEQLIELKEFYSL